MLAGLGLTLVALTYGDSAALLVEVSDGPIHPQRVRRLPESQLTSGTHPNQGPWVRVPPL
jgi:hypothetical protein